MEETGVGIGECVDIAVEGVDLGGNLRNIVLNLNRGCQCESSADEEDKGRFDLNHDLLLREVGGWFGGCFGGCFSEGIGLDIHSFYTAASKIASYLNTS